MPLFRSGTNKSTLSLMQRRTTKYQKFLNVSNVFLLITSTFLIFSAAILIKFYHLAKLDFWSAYFWVVPYVMIVLGVFTFCVTVFGFLISGSENRVLLIIYAGLLAIAFLVQLISIFTALELRNEINQPGYGVSNVYQDLQLYGEDASATAKWDDIQRDLHCCGGNGYRTGWQAYKNINEWARKRNGVPDSCCHTPAENCGANVFDKVEADAGRDIFTDGCVTLLESTLKEDVLPLMIGYAVVGVVLALAEIITVVIAAAYVAQIGRKVRREEKMWRHGTADHDGGAGGNDGTDAPLNSGGHHGDTMV